MSKKLEKELTTTQKLFKELSEKYVLVFGGRKNPSQSYTEVMTVGASGGYVLRQDSYPTLFESREKAEQARKLFYDGKTNTKVSEAVEEGNLETIKIRLASEIMVFGYQIAGVDLIVEGYYPWKFYSLFPLYYQQNEKSALETSQDYVAPTIKEKKLKSAWVVKAKILLKLLEEVKPIEITLAKEELKVFKGSNAIKNFNSIWA